MNPVLQAIRDRRSIRTFKSERVPQHLIDQVIEAGLYAPSGKGSQDSIILQIDDQKLFEQLRTMNRQIGGWSEAVDPFFGAPAMLVVLARKDNPNGRYDGALVMENLMLAAHSLGLGSCWINRARQEFDTEWGQQLLRTLGIEDEYEGIGHCILGYPDGEVPEAAPRKENRVYRLAGSETEPVETDR